MENRLPGRDGLAHHLRRRQERRHVRAEIAGRFTGEEAKVAQILKSELTWSEVSSLDIGLG